MQLKMYHHPLRRTHPRLPLIFCFFLAAFVRFGCAAAYVQSQDCLQRLAAAGNPVSKDPPLKPESLRASLTTLDDGQHQLGLVLSGAFRSAWQCDDFLRQGYSVGVTLDALGGLQHYRGHPVNASCFHASWVPKESGQTNVRFTLQANVSKPPPLAAFQLDTEIRGADNLTAACLTAFLTPSIGATMYKISLWGPLVVLLAVLLAAGWRETLGMGRVDDESSECHGTRSSRAHLTRIADCLSYIQFIFFSGALSLNYPGFFQPFVGSSSWTTLMLPEGLVVQTSVYDGVAHGIYEINGTFGGTPGLELMTQIIGAPISRFTWANIIANALLVLLVLFLVIRLGGKLRWTRDWFQGSSFWTIHDPALGDRKATIWVVLRVFLSYLLFPIVAWTAYQLLWAGLNPTYYSIVSGMVICLAMIACWWGLSTRGPENMGYLLIDGSQNQQPDHAVSRTKDVLAIATFALLFARGVATGALQAAGTVQLSILIACEVTHLCLIVWARPAPGLVSRGIIITGARLCVLLLDVAMIPGLSSLSIRSGVGYGILVFHAVVLIALFLVPSLYALARLAYEAHRDWGTVEPLEPAAQSRREERPQIYGLRQLHRRPTAQTNLSARVEFTSCDPSFSSNDSISNASTLDSGPAPPEELRTYFRSPRPEPLSIAASKSGQKCTAEDVSPSSASGPQVLKQDQNDPGALSHQLPMPSPSNPNVDYSFREADLYYVRPRRVSFRRAEADPGDLPASSAQFMGKIKSWVQWT